MTRFIAAAALALIAATPAAAQQGFALKGGAVFNSSTVEDRETNLRLADAAGWHIGAEYVLPLGIGIGISGYTSGSPDDFDTSSGSLVMLAEANYFFNLPILPISPYLGVHTGLGSYRLDDVRDRVRPEVDFGDFGYQVGVRFQPIAILGLDLQLRNVSGSLGGDQGGSFETRQVLLGVTVF